MVEEVPLLPGNWQSILGPEIQKPYFSKLISEVKALYASETVFPPAAQLFEAFSLCPFPRLKTVIVGQDPYHSAGQAHGLCFSVNTGVKVPPSLKNIYKELQADIPEFQPPLSGDLSGWARQGVLLLNAVLTVRSGEPGSHRLLGWERFTDAVISTISREKEAVVFLLWGKFALTKQTLIDPGKHLVLTAAHPSPLAGGAFFGCRHFSKANQWLQQKGMAPVNWQLS